MLCKNQLCLHRHPHDYTPPTILFSYITNMNTNIFCTVTISVDIIIISNISMDIMITWRCSVASQWVVCVRERDGSLRGSSSGETSASTTSSVKKDFEERFWIWLDDILWNTVGKVRKQHVPERPWQNSALWCLGSPLLVSRGNIGVEVREAPQRKRLLCCFLTLVRPPLPPKNNYVATPRNISETPHQGSPITLK